MSDELLIPLLAILCSLPILIPVMIALIAWSNQKRQIGTIRCKRCNHVGPAEGMWVMNRGMRPVCQKCQSEDWITVQNGTAIQPPPVPRTQSQPPIVSSTRKPTDKAISAAFETLGVPIDATPEQVREASRVLARAWHPDGFSHDPQLSAQAKNKMREINHANELLRDYFADGGRQAKTG